MNKKRAKYTQKSATAVNLDVFKSYGTKCFGKNANNFLIKNCQCLNRLIIALKYYKLLKVSNHLAVHTIFIEFCTNIYVKVLDDYNHILITHSHQLEEIYNQLISHEHFGKCHIQKCMMLKRHYNTNRRDNGINKNSSNFPNKQDALFIFYRELFDCAHHHLYHLFDVALRTQKMDDDTKYNMDDYTNPSNLIDHEFSRKKQYINNQRRKLGITIRRFDEKKSKYNIQIQDTQRNNRLTFIDALFGHFNDLGTVDHIKKLNTFIKDEKYDSDSLMDDIIDIGLSGSNIMKHIGDKKFIFTMKQFHKYTNYSTDFNIGFTWYYWKYYSKLTDIEEMDYQNINDHKGYNYKDLFVKQKYASFKTELLTHITIGDYHDLVLMKAQQYMVTEIVKSFWANDENKFLHYGIGLGDSIKIHHLISLIMYCDFTKYNAEFRASFGPIIKYETLHSIKQRNREYWWMSKLLRETVEKYGYSNRKYYYIHSWRRRESGPFFCGMNNVMITPSFNMRLCAPMSTSKVIEVAITFSKSSGMIMQLNNNGHTWSKTLNMFDSSWISKYKADDERLFIGGYEKIRIESIRIINTNNNFGVICHALFLFDNMVSGTSLFNSDMKLEQIDVDIIKKMVSSSFHSLDDYIIKCWKLFKKNKVEIVINMNYLYLWFNKDRINELIINSLQRTEDSLIIPSDNLISDVVFKTFPNIKRLIINTTSMTGRYSYKFSLFEFLRIIILSSSWRQIKILGVRFHDDCPGWIYYLWELSKNKLISIYSKHGLKIKCIQQKTPLYGGLAQDCFIIERK